MDLGVEIIWVLEADNRQVPGTAERCMEIMDDLGDPQVGWCVGDGQTLPIAQAFDDSDFSIGRGFDMIVPRDSMVVEFSSSHGSPGGNENLTGEELLAEIEAFLGGSR